MARGMAKTACCLLVTGTCVSGQIGNVSLTVPAGTPLRVYVTQRFPKRAGTAVSAKVIEPVYAFDRQVIPAGSTITGVVARTEPVRKRERLRAMVRGDFTPLKISLVEFELLRLPDGRPIPLRTVETSGLNTFYTEHRHKAKPPASPADPNAGKRENIEARIKGQVAGGIERVTDMVRGPGKMDRLGDFAMSKLPYHPQNVARGTRFDAELSQGLSFGSEAVPVQEITSLGSAPPADSVIAARLLTPLDSHTARRGDAVQAMITEPFFDAGHRLLLPEGTRLDGAVVVTRRARWLHRSGRLRFTFSRVELAPEALALRQAPAERTDAMLAAAEAGNGQPIKIDSEGGVKASDSKARFLAPLLAWIVAAQASDFDEGIASRIGTGAANQGGRALAERRTLGGASGFGLIGMAVSQSSPYVGMAMAYYGLAWSVFSNVISKGSEVRFEKNAALEVRFGKTRDRKGD